MHMTGTKLCWPCVKLHYLPCHDPAVLFSLGCQCNMMWTEILNKKWALTLHSLQRVPLVWLTWPNGTPAPLSPLHHSQRSCLGRSQTCLGLIPRYIYWHHKTFFFATILLPRETQCLPQHHFTRFNISAIFSFSVLPSWTELQNTDTCPRYQRPTWIHYIMSRLRSQWVQ